MGEYFRLFRHKLGLVALVIACFMMVAWLRSHEALEQVTFVESHRLIGFWSGYGCLSAKSIAWYSDTEWAWPTWKSGLIDNENKPNLPVVAEVLLGNSPNDFAVVIPYRNVVLVLASISAYLLLSKPRQNSKTAA